MAFLEELKRRKVIRVVGLYGATAWGASMGAAELFPTFGLPDESVRWFVIAAFALTPVVGLLAWFYEFTPGSIIRDPADQQLSGDTTYTGKPRGRDSNLLGLNVSWQDKTWEFATAFTIGRDASCELHIDDPKISRRHARVIPQSGIWYIEDLGSSNGTSLNGELVTRAVLPHEARVSLYEGSSEIFFELDTPSGAQTQLAGAGMQTEKHAVKPADGSPSPEA